MCVMVKGKKGRKGKAAVTVEAALLCPLLCLMICSMITFTLRLYRMVQDYAKEQMIRGNQGVSSEMLIRMEAMTEEVF